LTAADVVDIAYKGVLAAGVITGIIVSLRNRDHLKELHLTMNSRLDQLVLARSAQAFSEGAEHARATDKVDAAGAAAVVLATAADVAANVVAEAKRPPSTGC
jgi:hypothetical protein